MRDTYTGSLSEKLDYETQKERALQQDARIMEDKKALKIKEAKYLAELPSILRAGLEEEIKTLERTKLSMLDDESDREWRKNVMLQILKEFLAVDCSIYSSAKKEPDWLRDEYEMKRRQIRDIAYEN